MAWLQLPCVRYVKAAGSWHVKTQTPIMLGGRANVKCISPVRRPAGMDNGVVVDKAFSSNLRDGFF
jgi:hypothetical protein